MSYGIFNYENEEVGTCMMLVYDIDETPKGKERKSSFSTSEENKKIKTASKMDELFTQQTKQESTTQKKHIRPQSTTTTPQINKKESQNIIGNINNTYGQKNEDEEFKVYDSFVKMLKKYDQDQVNNLLQKISIDHNTGGSYNKRQQQF